MALNIRRSLSVLCMLGMLTSTAFAAGDSTVYYDASIKAPSLGNYQFNVETHEIPSHEYLPIVSKDYFPVTTAQFQTEVDNTAPSATYEAKALTKVDVVFAFGDMSQAQTMQNSIPNFESKLNSAGNNIDAYVQKVETSTVSTDSAGAEAIFATWDSKVMNSGLVGFQSDGTSTDWQLKNSQVTSNVSVRPGRAWLNPNYDTKGDMTIHFRFGLNSSASDFGHGESGFMFRVAEDARSMYTIIIDNHSACGTVLYDGAIVLCKIVNGKLSEITHKSIPMFAAGHNYSFDIDIHGSTMKITGDLTYTYDMSLDIARDPGLAQGSYGFYVWDQKNAYFDKISVTTGSSKSLGEAISDVAWRDNSVKFIVYGEDKLPDYMKNTTNADYQYTVTKLLNSNAYLIPLGTSTNASALQGLINKISSSDSKKGQFYYNSPISTALNNANNYIINIVRNMAKPTQWILVNTPVNWKTLYKDQEHDLPLNFGEHDGSEYGDSSDVTLASAWGVAFSKYYKSDKILAEKWRFRHNYTYYDNATHQETFHDVWLSDPVDIFPEPGLYRINYKRKDNPFYPDVDFSNPFDEYRYWSTDYDPVVQGD